MATKYLREARECLDKVAAGARAKLDPSVRRGMVGELRARGVEVYKERADAYVAQRYYENAPGRADTWSDEARAAALEARRASAKAKESGRPEDHREAAAKHRQAATMFGVGASGEGGKDVEAKASQQHHEKMAAVEHERASVALVTGRAAEPETGGEKIPPPPANFGKPGFEAAHTKYNEKWREAEAASNRAHGTHAGMGPETKATEAAAHKTAMKAHQAAAKAAAAIGDKQNEAQHKIRAGEHATEAKSLEATGKAYAASAKAKGENSVSAHGEASTAHNAAAKAAAKAGATSLAAEHKQRASEHLAAMRNVHNANVQLENRAREGSPIGRAEAEAKAKSSAAKEASRKAEPSGTMTGPAAPHAAAARAHREASEAHLKVERIARAAGNEFKASAARSYAEQHAVKAGEHDYAANAQK